MRKRLLAILCVLALMVGIVAPVVPVSAAAASTGSFKAGYARVDINPWEDPYDSDKDGSKGGIMQLPLRGSGNTIHRQSVSTLIDDNGNGKIDEEDGLFATCIVVTGTNGETVVMISAAVIGGFERMVSDARASIVTELKKEGINISGDQIMISGTHTHNSVDLNQYKDSFATSDKSYELFDQTGALTGNYITAQQVYANFSIWYPYLIDQLTNAAVTAFEDQDVATMKKGSIEASTAAGCVMNSVRQYSRVARDGSVYVCGDNSNMGISYSKYNANIYEANDTMHVLQFSFSNGNDPIVLTNWRGHSSLNNKNGTRLNVSSDYINAFSYQLEQKNYRPIFIQGAAGNVNPASKVTGEYEWINAGFDADGDGIWEEGDALPGNTYGKKLAEVALSCLSNNMSNVDVGEVKTASTIYCADAKIWTEDVQYYAALTAEAYYDAGYDDAAPFVYPTTAINNSTFFATLDKDLQTKATSYKNIGDTYIIASTYHAADILDNHVLADKNTTGKERVELCAFTLGEGVSFVTAPGELYDHYNSDLDWSDLSSCTTQTALYNKVDSFSNDWDNLIGSTYGTPFVMGYCNGTVGYFPNTLAYTYNSGSTYAATGSYEAHCTELAKGEGEKLIETFDYMLTYLTGGSSTLYNREAYCPACKETVYWQKMNADYNNVAHITGGDALGLGAGHYYLTEDITSAEKSIATGAEVCIDLNGYNITGTDRAFLLQCNSTLNLMDTTEAADGVVSAVGGTNPTSGWYGGVVSVDAGSELNLYSGTLSQTIKDGYYVARGGVLHVKGTFNMYGGTVTGGKTVRITSDTATGNTYGGNIYVQGGTMTMSGGTISDGWCYGDNIGNGGNIYLGSRTVDGDEIYSNVTISGGTISGGKAESSTEGISTNGGNIYVPAGNSLTITGGTISGGTATVGASIRTAAGSSVTLSGAPDINQIYLYDYDVLTVTGRFTGSAELLYRTTPTASGKVIGTATEGAAVVTENLTINGSEWVPVVSGTDLITGVAQSLCPFCGQMCIWNPVDSEYLSENASGLATGHYRLSGDAASAQLTPATNAQICFDLNGYTFTGATRAFNMDSNSKGSVVHIGDTSEMQTGTACGKGGSKYAGGVLYVRDATLYIHGGTFRQTENVTTAAGNKGGILCLFSGATVYMSGGTLVGPDITGESDGWGAAVHVRNSSAASTFNMTGGTIQGGSAKIGAAMYVEAGAGNVCNLSGGTITSGTATTKGTCVYVAGGDVNLSGDVKVADIYYEDSTVSADTLKIDTTKVAFTGIIGLSYATALNSGDVIGTCTEGTSLGSADINLQDGLICSVNGTNLRAAAPGAVAIYDPAGKTYDFQESFAAALGNYTYSETDTDTLVLYGDMGENVTLTQNICLDMNGYSVTGTISNVGGYTVYCYDSATDDYTVEDNEGYGKIPVSVNAQPMDGYLMLQVEEDGVTYNTFHRIDLDIQYLDLDISNVEMYYESAYAGDEIVEDNVASYGIVVSITAEPELVNGAFTSDCLYTEATDYTAGSDLVEGARITNILSSDNSTTTNKRYANTPMYGKAYIKLNDGTYVLGQMETKTLRQTVEALATDPVASVSDEVIGLYNDFSATMSNWNIGPIRTAAAAKVQAAEDAALKVLVIGNSHSLDSTNLLYDVFMEEGLPTGYDSLVLGAMYESGCKMYEHAAAIKNNTALYDYYKANSSSYAKESDHWYTTTNVTLQTALLDEQWDIVVIQEMNTYATVDANYRTGDMETVINYIDSKLAKDPIILWNLLWANPEIPEGYDESNYKESWIYKIAQPYSSYANVVSKWEAYYETLGNDDQTMYSEIVRNYNTYVATNRNVEGALLSGTAIQQAKNWLMDNYGYSEVEAEQMMHRDYTHLSDYSRTMVAYLWYAQLMELVDGDNFDWADVAEAGLQFTTVPKAIRHKSFRTADLVLTQDQQDLIINVITEVLKDDDYSVAKPVAEQ